MFTLRNDFHGTSVRVRGGEMSRATVNRVKRTLCGIKGCTCSGQLGTRGEQECEKTIDNPQQMR